MRVRTARWVAGWIAAGSIALTAGATAAWFVGGVFALTLAVLWAWSALTGHDHPVRQSGTTPVLDGSGPRPARRQRPPGGVTARRGAVFDVITYLRIITV